MKRTGALYHALATIKYAVLVPAPPPAGREGPSSAPDSHTAAHLYQHRADADRCAQAYRSALHVPAVVVGVTPALAVARRADAWAALDRAAQRLRVYEARETAEAQARAQGLRLLSGPIRRAMPVQLGVPQFAPSARPAGLWAPPRGRHEAKPSGEPAGH